MSEEVKRPRLETRFKCVVCGKATAGRIGRDGGLRGDGSARYPRRHYVAGELCPGCFAEAEWVAVTKGKRSESSE